MKLRERGKDQRGEIFDWCDPERSQRGDVWAKICKKRMRESQGVWGKTTEVEKMRGKIAVKEGNRKWVGRSGRVSWVMPARFCKLVFFCLWGRPFAIFANKQRTSSLNLKESAQCLMWISMVLLKKGKQKIVKPRAESLETKISLEAHSWGCSV